MKILFTAIISFCTIINCFSQSNGCISGDCSNGWGIYKWTTGTGSGDKYIGEWKDGNRSGMGVYFWNNGDKYVGSWSSGTMNGYGTQFYANGTKSIGYWVDGALSTSTEVGKCASGDCENGYGTWIYNSGDIYAGYWSGGVRTGQGIYLYSDGDWYSGDFEDNKRSGYGTYYWSDGGYYIGYWKNSNQNGSGSYTKADGTKQTGNFENGKFIGENSYTSNSSSSNSSSTSGCIKGDCDNGYGIYVWGSGNWEGDKYIGEWKDGKMQGLGFYQWHSGTKYIGEWSNGKQEGYGSQLYSDGTKSQGRFSGGSFSGTTSTDCVSGECKNGYGTWIYSSGDMYKGYFSSGLREGQGTYLHSDGARYEGSSDDDERSGFGTFYWADGSNHAGYWKDGKQHGSGTYTMVDGTKQVGNYENGSFVGESKNTNTNIASSSKCLSGDCDNGFGIYEWGEGKWKGDKYIGEWKDGYMSGQGFYSWNTGSKYIGGWLNGKQSGYGTQFYGDGSKVVGYFQEGNRTSTNENTSGCFSGNCSDGYGVWIYDSGDKYEGYFKDGKRSGQGTYLFSDGMKYIGNFEENLRNGLGTFYWADGSFHTGYWKSGNQNGQGQFTKVDGTVQKGLWENGVYKGEVDYTNYNQNIASNNKQTNSNESNENFTNSKASISDRIKAYVEERVNEWQQKGEFEKTTDYKIRVNEASRNKKIEECQKEAIAILKKEYLKSINYQDVKLGLYDADNESFIFSSDELGEFVVPVPVTEAPNFKKGFSTYQFSNTDLYIKDNKFVLAHTEIVNPTTKKKYIFDSKNDVTYATTSINYTFNDIVINVENKAVGTGGSIKKGTNSITVGKSDVDMEIPVSQSAKSNAYALIIGNEDYTTYQPGLSSEVNVDFAANDATIFKDYCVKTFGIPEKQIKLLINATSAQMNQGVAWLTNLAKVEEGNAEIIFYYSGHGLPDEQTKEGYLIPVDVSGSSVTQGVKLNDLYTKLNEFPSKKVTVFLDACFSGGARNQGLVAMKGVKVRPKENVVNGNMVVFTSSTGEESSGVYREKQHGYLTYFLLKNIQETKGNISYKDLANFLINGVKKETALNGKIQTPQVNFSTQVEGTWENWKVK